MFIVRGVAWCGGVTYLLFSDVELLSAECQPVAQPNNKVQYSSRCPQKHTHMHAHMRAHTHTHTHTHTHLILFPLHHPECLSKLLL